MRFAEECVLPCQFEAVGDETIYWFRQDVLIQTYKQPSGLSDHNNTIKPSLLSKELSGNASFTLQKAGPRDRGKYMCVVTSSLETSQQFIIVKVEAPIHSVQLETTRLSGFEEVKCSTRNVYPAPRITLFTEPTEAKPGALHPFTRKTADTHGLYTAESKLRKLQDLTYICLVQSFYSSQMWRSSMLETEIFATEGQDFTIPCVSPWSLENFTLTWSFSRQHKSSIFYVFDSMTQRSSSIWKETVQLQSPEAEAGDGTLWIFNPERVEHSGTYTCTLSAPQTRHLVHVTVSIVPQTDTRITCIYDEECTLPCKSSYTSVIHWYKDDAVVHSFYHGQDQLSYQVEKYKGRTSLPTPAEKNQGNVSLRLKNIRIEDEGRYRCYSADDKSNIEAFVLVSVEAPVKLVNITLVDDTVACTTSGVYPEPDVQWSSTNSFNEPNNTFRKTKENLFMVTSMIKVDATHEAYMYSCLITSKDSKQTLYNATLEHKGPQANKFTFECPVTKDYTVSLRFSSIVLQYDHKTSKKEISEEWKTRITFNPEAGTLELSPVSKEQEGEYTWDCASVLSRHIMKIKLLQGGMNIIIPIVTIMVIIFVVLILVVKFRGRLLQMCAKDGQNTPDSTSEERQNMKIEKTNGTN
ncbi:hypothetical protein DNTS_017783 [Danionella cerebrum]|uniref:Ig-like domain-containing protein n=1 Tax=Danionella cerebrum TaxID=2873325 RepID=A0A553QI45_9TELE|nr:hypothetical protein DNTS_017783 [Danionella translucida]